MGCGRITVIFLEILHSMCCVSEHVYELFIHLERPIRMHHSYAPLGLSLAQHSKYHWCL